MANYCDKPCKYFVENECNHPDFKRNKIFLEEDGKKCGGFTPIKGLNDKTALQRARNLIKKEERKEEMLQKKEEEKAKYELTIQKIKEDGFDAKDGFNYFFDLSSIEQYYVWETLVKKRKPLNVMREVNQELGKSCEATNVRAKIRRWSMRPNIMKATGEITNIIAKKSKQKLDLIVDEMVDKVAEAVGNIDIEHTMPEDVIRMGKDVLDMRNKIQDKNAAINIQDSVLVFGDGSSFGDIYKKNSYDLPTEVIEADFEERW